MISAGARSFSGVLGDKMKARERFEHTRRCVKRLNEVKLLIMYDCDDWKPQDIRIKHQVSDPTANRAAYNVDELGDKLEALRKEEQELLEFIGVSLAVIGAVKLGFGEVYATVLEARYIDCWKWAQIREEYGIPKSTGHYLLDIAFDWVDSVGVSRLLNGDVEV